MHKERNMKTNVQYPAKYKYDVLMYAEANGIKNATLKYDCTERTIFRWKKKFDGTLHSLENDYSRKGMSHPTAHTEEEIENIKEVMKRNPYITHKELYEILKRDYGYSRHPGGLYNYLRRNRMVPEPKLKNNYATMFDSRAVKQLNGKFLFNNKNILPLYLIELNNDGIYIAREDNNNPCKLTVYYSTSLRFETKQEAENFLNSINNTSNYKLTIKEINYKQGENL